MVKIREMRCVYCGAHINEMHANNPADGLHPEYDKNAKEDPKYCCYQCSIITEINRVYGAMIKGERTPLEVASVIREKAAYIRENGAAINQYYVKQWQKRSEDNRANRK